MCYAGRVAAQPSHVDTVPRAQTSPSVSVQAGGISKHAKSYFSCAEEYLLTYATPELHAALHITG